MTSQRSTVDYKGPAHVWVAALVLVFTGLFLLALVAGRYSLSLNDVLNVLTGTTPSNTTDYRVVVNLRLPRTIVAALIGVGLSLSGLLYQETFQNKLVSPDFLGVTSGASVGAAVAILWGMPSVVIGASAFAAGIATVVLTLTLSKVFSTRSPTILLLSGIIVGGMMSAALSLIKYFADPDTTLASIVYWLMGSCEHVGWGDVMFLAPVVIVCTVAMVLVRYRLNLVAMGRDAAVTKGVDYDRWRLIIICVSTLLTAASVSVVGAVGWVGLVVPHMARILVGRNTLYSVPVAVMTGACMMVLVDIVSRSFTDAEVPLSAITGFIGSLLFIGIMVMRRRSIVESD